MKRRFRKGQKVIVPCGDSRGGVCQVYGRIEAVLEGGYRVRTGNKIDDIIEFGSWYPEKDVKPENWKGEFPGEFF